MAEVSRKPTAEIHESLDVYNDPPNATVDIVAVPGLGANPVKSWQWNSSSSQFNWITEKKSADSINTSVRSDEPRDIGGLAKDCPSARVLLYNYASAYQGAYRIEQYMTNIVSILLDQLKAKRENHLRRPLVFLGHSMGGLVIAKALVIVEQQGQKYPDMYEATSGCLFFGTPFNGAPVADIAKEWTIINERLGKAVDSQLLTLLRPGNEQLKELKHDFVRSVNKLGQKVRVHCFWEQEETHWEPLIAKLASQEFPPSSLGKLRLNDYRQFVSRESATLSGMDQTGLPRTHRDLVRFESDKDPEYQLVRAPLRDIVNAAPRTAKARFNDTRQLAIDRASYRQVLEVLEGAQPQQKLRALEQKLTSESWIVRDREPQYVDWLDSTARDNNYLWVNGYEGKGKSTAAAAIIGTVKEKIRSIENREDQPPSLLAYFFCDAMPDYCTAEDVVKSLLRQLCKQQEVLASYATQFLERKLEDKMRKKASLSIENLWQSLEEMMSERTIGTIYFVINNLHQLDQQSPSTTKLFNFIRDDIERTSSGKHSKALTKWLITSRNDKAIRDTLGVKVRTINLNDPKYGNQQHRELQKYAWTKANNLQKIKGYTMAMTYFIGSVIGNRANHIRWIDVAVAQLAALPAGASEIELQRMLEHVPRDFKSFLKGAWRAILKQDDEDTGEIREILRVLVLTYEDPRENELLVLTGHSIHSGESKASLLRLINKCQPLVTTRTSGDDILISFANVEVKKNLLDHSQEFLGIGDEWTKWQHGKMSLRCFSHIMDAIGKGRQVPKTTNPEGDQETGGRPRVDSAIDLEPSTMPITNPDWVTGDPMNERGPTATQEEAGALDSAEQDSLTAIRQLCGPRCALDYATRYWLRHASDASPDVAKIISGNRSFWDAGSEFRLRWLQEYEDLTKSLKGFNFATWNALHVAAAIGFPRLVTALLKEGYQEEVHQYDVLHNKPLHLAAFYGNVEIVEELLNAKSPVDDMGPEGHSSSPLAMAAYNGQTAVMSKLITPWGANINAVDGQTGPVLNAAILSGNLEAVNLLLQKGVRINYAWGEVQVAPLAMSAFHSDLKMFSAILESIESKLTSEEFHKALVWASAAGNLGVLQRLLQFEHTYFAYQDSLNNATAHANWEACYLILRHPQTRGLNCIDLFERAAADNNTSDEILRACWENRNGHIPQQVLDMCLYEATDKEKESTVELLLSLGSSPNATGDEFGNALTASANDGTLSILLLLLRAGADVNSPDGYALQQAAAQGQLAVVEALLRAGAHVNQVNERHPSRTALQAACDSGHLNIARLLLCSGANPNLGGGEYTRPIFSAIYFDNNNILDELLRAPILELDIVGGPLNSTPLAAAIFYLPAERVALLIDRGATVDFADQDGDTALTTACFRGDADCIRLLLERGADFLKVTRYGKTALQIAMEKGNVDCSNLLLARADLLLRGLQSAAELGDQRAQHIIASERQSRARAVVAGPAEANANAAGGAMAGPEPTIAGIPEEGSRHGGMATNVSEQSWNGNFMPSGDDQEIEAPERGQGTDGRVPEPTGYPTPCSVIYEDRAPGDHVEEGYRGEEHQGGGYQGGYQGVGPQGQGLQGEGYQGGVNQGGGHQERGVGYQGEGYQTGGIPGEGYQGEVIQRGVNEGGRYQAGGQEYQAGEYQQEGPGGCANM